MPRLSLAALFALMIAAGPVLAAPEVRLQTSMGDIVVSLNRDKAPVTVANFLDYVRAGFYDGTLFHRVIAGFMIQGGGFTTDYQRKPTRAPIKNEADNGLQNRRGTIAMARTSAPNSATSQFFINVADNTFLDYRAPTPRDWGYAVFGKVIKGMSVVDAISHVVTGSAGPFAKNAPLKPVVIEHATIINQD